jgi:hypothetical protein
MAISGFPTVTGDVLTSSTMNSLVQFDVVTQTGDYTATTNDGTFPFISGTGASQVSRHFFEKQSST